MRIGFDFDRVLFDTDSFDKELKSRIDKLEHVDENVRDEHGNYVPEMHAEVLGINPENIYRVVREISPNFLYGDVQTVGQLGQECVIVTRGNEKFQSMKVESSGVLEYFDGYVVVESGPKDQADIDFLIDDREEEIKRIDLPGIVFDRSQENLEQVLEELRNIEA